MIVCPLEAPVRLTQRFGENPQIYSQFGLVGHSGTDYTGPEKGVLVPVFSPYDCLVWKVGDQGNWGWGKYIVLLTDEIASGFRREVILAHLSEIYVTMGQRVYFFDRIGKMGNTGFSTGPHLHVGIRYRDKETLVIKDYNNGYHGYVNFEQYLKFVPIDQNLFSIA